MGVAGLLAIAACGSQPGLMPLAQQPGRFDECGLVAPTDLADVIGVEVHITSREAVPQPNGARLAGCSYLAEDVPGMVGMTINTMTGTDRERFFAPFKDRDATPQPGFGDYAEIVAEGASSTGRREIRAIRGTTGVHVRYVYAPGWMPALDDDQFSTLLEGTVQAVLEALPGEVNIADGSPEGPCADIDLAHASQVLGDELTTARSVLGRGGAVNCMFAGVEVSLSVAVVTDSRWVQGMRASAAHTNMPDIGDGARLQVQRQRHAGER